MHPILWTLHLAPETARWAALVMAVVLSGFVVWDTVGSHGRAKLVSGLVQGLVFFAIAFPAAWIFVTPERLPPDVVIEIRAWGVATIVGMVSCFLIQRHLGREHGLAAETIFSLWVYGGLAAIAGARLLHVAVNWSSYAANPVTALAFWDGGMVYIGAVSLALLVCVLYARKHGLGARAFDVLLLGIALTQGLGRLGCFFAGCCYGRETTLPWGVSFPVGSIAHYTMIQTGELAADALATPHLHPTELYEAAACFLLGGALLLWYRKKTPAPGVITAAYFALYSAIRFVIELFRNDPDRQFVVRIPEAAPLLLSTSQALGLVLIVIAVIFGRRLAAQRP